MLRELSNEAFGRPHQLEIAAAVAGLEGTFTVEEVLERVRALARNAGEDAPGPSAVRKGLARLSALRTLSRVKARKGESDLWMATESKFWPWLNDLLVEIEAPRPEVQGRRS